MYKPDEKTLKRGIRTVALFELTKGVLVILAGFAILQLIHHDLQEMAENIVKHIHLNPARHYPKIFIEAAGRITDSKIKWFAAFAFLYSTIRFVEAYGLWNFKVWAEWFAILSGGIYIPIEIFELIKNPSWVKAGVLLINIFIVAYLVYVRVILHEKKKQLPDSN